MKKYNAMLAGMFVAGLLFTGESQAQPPIIGPSINMQPRVPSRAHTMKADARNTRDTQSKRTIPDYTKSNNNNSKKPSTGSSGKAPSAHRSAADGRTQSVTESLERDPNLVRQRDSSGYTILHHAAIGGHTETVGAIIEKGAKLDTKGSRGETALYLAASKGNAEVVKLLAESGANPNLKTAAGKTPLHRAAMEGNLETVRALLDAGADATVKDRSGKTAADLAAHFRKGDSEKVVRLLNSQ